MIREGLPEMGDISVNLKEMGGMLSGHLQKKSTPDKGTESAKSPEQGYAWSSQSTARRPVRLVSSCEHWGRGSEHGAGLCEWRAVHRAGGWRVGLSRGSVTLRVGGKSLEGAQQSHGDAAWLPFPQARSGVCVENALRGPWADSGAPFRRLVQ